MINLKPKKMQSWVLIPLLSAGPKTIKRIQAKAVSKSTFLYCKIWHLFFFPLPERQTRIVKKKETPFCFCFCFCLWNGLSWIENESDKNQKQGFGIQLFGEPNREMAGSLSYNTYRKKKRSFFNYDSISSSKRQNKTHSKQDKT